MSIIFKELIATDIDAKNEEEVIRQVGRYMFDNGFVKDSYINAVLERELDFPTGLQLKGIGIAMPHTNSSHVNKPAICIAQLKNPVTFSHMGDADTKVKAELIFMMAIQNPNEQIENLQKVLKVFGNENATNEFKAAKNNEELFKLAQKYID